MEQMSLLQELLPEGFTYIPDFITAAEEETLLGAMGPLDWQQVKMHGVIAKRRVVHYGLNYHYQSHDLEPTEPPPKWMYNVLAKAAAALRVAPVKIAEVLVTHYPPGAGIGWHRDAPMFGDAVFGVSLGSTSLMKLRRKRGESFETKSVVLAPRSAYIIAGPARREWQHHLPGVKADRWSITFRTLKNPPDISKHH